MTVRLQHPASIWSEPQERVMGQSLGSCFSFMNICTSLASDSALCWQLGAQGQSRPERVKAGGSCYSGLFVGVQVSRPGVLR